MNSESGLWEPKFSPVFDPTGKVKSASGSYMTDFGKISVSWKALSDNIFEYLVEVPSGIGPSFDFRDMKIVSEECAMGNYRYVLEI